MSATIETELLSAEDRTRMEELRPLVEEVVVSVLSFIVEDDLRAELRVMTEEARQAVARSEVVRAEAEAKLVRAEAALRSS